ncbi:hypothetical protein HZB02_05615 [Candidatus Woesearchaeota archaeon]|nr:hypothetical protein [Candidatus Woesearchaeota archaeon]
MKLQEYKGKELLQQYGFEKPDALLVTKKNLDDPATLLALHAFCSKHPQVMVKAQVIGGQRKKQGFVQESKGCDATLSLLQQLFSKMYQTQSVLSILVEEKIAIAHEYFLALLYDTRLKTPMLLFSSKGGIDIESHREELARYPISPIDGLSEESLRSFLHGLHVQDAAVLVPLLLSAYQCFTLADCLHLEINPLIKTNNGVWYAGDAKITIDDAAIPRQPFLQHVQEEASFLTPREIAARQVDALDYRGVAGRTFMDLPGTIAILASGGGASLTCMDALMRAGGKPANYTEYSGNPSREKVRKLTEITLSKPDLTGCLVIGGTANFTDVYETLAGFMDAVLVIKPSYPIVIRRAGPRDAEAFAMIRSLVDEHHFNVTLFGEETPMTKAVLVMVKKAEEYYASL